MPRPSLGKKYRKRVLRSIRIGVVCIAVVSIVVLAGSTSIYAGTLSPSSTPGSTMQSLSDIAGSGFDGATHSLKALYDKINGLVTDIWNKQTSDLTSNGSVGKLLVNNLDTAVSNTSTPLTGTYDASSVTADANGNVMEQLEFIMQNLGGYTYGSSNAGEVLTTANGTYNATFLTAANVRSGVAFGVNSTGTYGGGGWTYGSDDASKVLTTADAAGTYDSSNLSAATVKSGTTFGVSLTGDYPSSSNLLPGASADTDLAASAGNITSSNGSIEWWQSDGTRQTATLDFPSLSNLCDSDTSNNSTGTLSISAVTIGTGNTYCGTAGTLLADLFNGTDTGSSFPGGLQASGGVDDYNNGGSPPSDRYSKNWTTCNSGNNYCGTGLSSADAKDDSTNLVWSLPCNGSGCTSFSDSSPLTYSWDNSHANNNSKTASELCSSGGHGESGWFLPHQKQLMQAYIDGSYGNLEASGVSRAHWSATTKSSTTTTAWNVNLSTGYTTNTTKTNAKSVRCVRSAN